jgi:hypothetical protein
MAGTVEDVLLVARRNLGFVEGPRNENPYAPLVGHAQHQPWCASFVAAVMLRAGVELAHPSAYTPTMANGFKREKRWHNTGKVGDVVFFAWPGMGRIAHVGIVEVVLSPVVYQTIEGNTDSAGGRTGGRVMRQRRRAHIAGFGRPAYAVPKQLARDETPRLLRGSGGPGSSQWERAKVADVQRALHKGGYLKGRASVVVDGDYGLGTETAVRLLQRGNGLVSNGQVGDPEWALLKRIAHG